MLLNLLFLFVFASSVELIKQKDNSSKGAFTALGQTYLYKLFPDGKFSIYQNPIADVEAYSVKPISFSWDSLNLIDSFVIDPPDFPMIYTRLEVMDSKLYFFGSYKNHSTIIQKTFSSNGRLSSLEWTESLTTDIKTTCIDEGKLYIGGSDGILQYPLLQDGTFDIEKGSMVLPTYRMHAAQPHCDYAFTVRKETLYVALDHKLFWYKIKNMGKSGLDVCSQEFIQLPEELLNISPSQLFFWKERLFMTFPKKVTSIDFSMPQIDFQTVEFDSEPLFSCHNKEALCISSPQKITFFFNTLNFDLKNDSKKIEAEQNTFFKKILDFFCFYGKREKKLEEIADLEKYYEL